MMEYFLKRASYHSADILFIREFTKCQTNMWKLKSQHRIGNQHAWSSDWHGEYTPLIYKLLLAPLNICNSCQVKSYDKNMPDIQFTVMLFHCVWKCRETLKYFRKQ